MIMNGNQSYKVISKRNYTVMVVRQQRKTNGK
jgi:hypothetical protein